jgi:predicted amidohydrolase YtcJ
MLAEIKLWADRTKSDDWIIGRGWNESIWPEAVPPTKKELDEVTGTNQPAVFWRADLHSAVANSAALRITGIDRNTQDPDGGAIGRDQYGQPDGRLFELAVNLVMPYIPMPATAELEDIFCQGIATLHSLGVTAIHSQRMKDQNEGPLALDTFLRLRENGNLKLRINSNVAAHHMSHLDTLGLRSGFGDDYLRLGHIKLFYDGTLGSKTAWMLEPFDTMEGDTLLRDGIRLTPPEQMAREIMSAARRGFPVSIHAIGDRANREVLDLLEELASATPALSIPNRIEHVQIIDPLDIPRLASLDVTASVQPLHALDDMDIADRLLGARSNRAYNFGSLVRSGTLLAFGSDAPVADPNPFLGFHAAMFRQRPENLLAEPWFGGQRLSLEETIYGYTMGPARATGWDSIIGSLTVGKRADMIILDRDLFSIRDSGTTSPEIADARILATFFDGHAVYQAEPALLTNVNEEQR